MGAKTPFIIKGIRHSVYFGEHQSELIEKIDEQTPDIVLLAGDIADDINPHQGTIDLLKGLAGKYPCYYVSGNHEYWTYDIDNVKSIIRDNGAKILEGGAEPIFINGDTILISGVDDPEIGNDIFDVQLGSAATLKDSDNFKNNLSILMSHRPERIDQYTPYNYDLIVSGHTHGGLWRIPFIINGVFAPNQGYFPKYGGGRYDIDTTTMIVSRGLQRGIGKYPRIFNPPEVVVINIVPKKAQ